MTEDEWYSEHGLFVVGEVLDLARTQLAALAEGERRQQGSADTGLMRLLAAQLFCAGKQGDIELIWNAKRSSMDADGAIDAEMLCVGGLESALAYLAGRRSEAEPAEIQRYLEQRRKDGDLDRFDVDEYKKFLGDYYKGYADDAGG